MHEGSMAASIVRIVREEAERHGVNRISRVVLRVGVFTGLEPMALRGAFELLAEGTAAEGATLSVERGPARAVCEQCGHAFELVVLRARCPACGGDCLRCSGGRECVVERMEGERV